MKQPVISQNGPYAVMVEQGNLYRWSDTENDFVQQGKSDKKGKGRSFTN